MSKIFRFTLLTLSLVFCLSAIAFGQQTGGTIEGTVKDPQGAVVPGATVSVQGVNVGFSRTVQTNDEGVYRLAQVPPGTYRVTIAPISGFTEFKAENIVVVIEKTTTVDANLSTQVGAVVDVTSDQTGVVVDSTDSKIQSNITNQLIESLPKGTSFTSVLKAAPSVRIESQLTSANGSETGWIGIDGASSAENTFLIDGQEVTNFRSGTLNRVNNLPTSLVQEVQVKTSGFEAEHGGASGGVIVVGTKGGTNEWRGEFGLQFETSKLQPAPRSFAPVVVRTGTNQLAYSVQQPRDSYNNVFPTATFGGPVVKDRVWFIGSWTPQIFRTTRTVNYYQPITVASGSTLRLNNSAQPQTFNAKTTYEYGFGRVDAAITNNIRVFASYLWNPAIFDGTLPQNAITIGGLPLSTRLGGTLYSGSALAAQQGGRTNSNNFATQVTWTPTQRAVASFRYGRTFLNERGTAAYGIPNETRFICTGFAPLPAGTGCDFGFQNISGNTFAAKDVSVRNTFNADLSYNLSNFGGSHIFKGGYEYGKVKNDVARGYRNTGIVQLFYNESAEDVGVPIDCDLDAGCLGVGELLRFGTVGIASNRYNALYVQDKWQPFRRLTLNLGVRFENENLPAFNTSGSGGQAGIPLTFGWGDKIAPRLGGAFDIFGDGKSRIFASYGLFYDRLKFELPRGSFGGDFYRDDYFPILAAHPEYTYYTLSRIIGNFSDPIGGGNPSTAGGLSQFQLDYRIPSNLNPSVYQSLGLPVGGVDPDLKPFTQSEITFGFEREFFSNYVLTARFTRKNVENAIEDQANLGTFESENYIIGNPGKGLAFQQRQAAGYIKQAEAQREYKAVEVVLNRRLANNYYYNVNYTWSRLYGNYTGLASSDEAGRASPGVNRFFDYVINGFTATGAPDNGLLPTDRTHTFKAYGGYTWQWWGSKTNETEFSAFQTIASGTPQTTFINVASTSIPLSKRGDLGRTETFTQSDVSLYHRYRFGRDNRFTLIGEINVLNLFNENNVTAFNTTRYLIDNTLSGVDLDPCYNPNGTLNTGCTGTPNILLTTALNNVLRGNATAALQATENRAGNKNIIHGAPAAFQTPRNVRFGFRLVF